MKSTELTRELIKTNIVRSMYPSLPVVGEMADSWERSLFEKMEGCYAHLKYWRSLDAHDDGWRRDFWENYFLLRALQDEEIMGSLVVKPISSAGVDWGELLQRFKDAVPMSDDWFDANYNTSTYRSIVKNAVSELADKYGFTSSS